MTSVEALVTKHPVLMYFVLTFIISWGGVLLVIGGPSGLTGMKAHDNPIFPFALLAMVAGPSITAMLLTGLIDGKQGFRAMRRRLLKCRVGIRWYAVAILAAPLAATAVTLTLSRFSSEFVPALVVAGDRGAVLLLGLVVGITAGFFEELGWTGFAIARLKLRHGVLTTGLIVGLLWSAWHLLVVAWGIGDRAGTIPLALFAIVDGLAALPAFRVLMVWIYDRTESLFLAMLMHASLTATTLILTPQTTGHRLVAYGLTFAVAVWLVIAGIRARELAHIDRIGRARSSRWPLSRSAQRASPAIPSVSKVPEERSRPSCGMSRGETTY
jgi:membrane protease YdiL (CAAX protease family)